MKRNIGGSARLVRALFGVTILVVGAATQSWWALVGLIPIVLAIVGYCPLRAVPARNSGGDTAEAIREKVGSCCSNC